MPIINPEKLTWRQFLNVLRKAARFEQQDDVNSDLALTRAVCGNRRRTAEEVGVRATAVEWYSHLVAIHSKPLMQAGLVQPDSLVSTRVAKLLYILLCFFDQKTAEREITADRIINLSKLM